MSWFIFQIVVAILLVLAAIAALIYGSKYQEDVRKGKNDHEVRWWEM